MTNYIMMALATPTVIMVVIGKAADQGFQDAAL